MTPPEPRPALQAAIDVLSSLVENDMFDSALRLHARGALALVVAAAQAGALHGDDINLIRELATDVIDGSATVQQAEHVIDVLQSAQAGARGEERARVEGGALKQECGVLRGEIAMAEARIRALRAGLAQLAQLAMDLTADHG